MSYVCPVVLDIVHGPAHETEDARCPLCDGSHFEQHVAILGTPQLVRATSDKVIVDEAAPAPVVITSAPAPVVVKAATVQTEPGKRSAKGKGSKKT